MAEYSRNILVRAAESGNLRVLKEMLKKGADVNRRGSDYKTPLMVAAEHGNIEAMRVLIQAGADVNRFIGVWDTPLKYAVKYNHLECVSLLIEAGTDVNRRTNRRTPLMVALSNGHDDAARLLIKAGANVGDSLLRAAREGNAKFVSTLMETRSDWNLLVALARLLIKAGADKNINDLLFIASREGHHQCVNLLLEAGADVNYRHPSYSSSPLHYAAENGYVKCVTLLINGGADVNRIDTFPKTPLVPAVRNGHIGCVSALIKAEANVNHENCHDLLGHAHSVQMVRLLLRSGDKINKSWCYWHGYLRPEKQAVELLLAAGDKHWLNYPQTKADDLMGMCREVIREHLLKLDPHTHLFGRVTRLGLPAALTSYLVFDQSLDDDVKHDFNEEN